MQSAPRFAGVYPRHPKGSCLTPVLVYIVAFDVEENSRIQSGSERFGITAAQWTPALVGKSSM